MQIVDFIFMAAIVTLFLATVRLEEINASRKVFGQGKITPKKNGGSVLDYISNDKNLSNFKLYFYYRNILKALFVLFCLSSTIYAFLIAISTIQITPAVPALPVGAAPKDISIVVQSEGASFDGTRYELKSSVVVTRTRKGNIAAYSYGFEKKGGHLIWLSGSGLVENLNIQSLFQIFGFLSLVLGIATFAYATVLRQNK